MNSYQSMSVPGSASASFAQFYQHAAAASAASAGAIGVDSLGNACTQPSSGVVPTGGAGQSIADLPRYPWMTLTGKFQQYLKELNLIEKPSKALNVIIKVKITGSLLFVSLGGFRIDFPVKSEIHTIHN